MKSATKYEKIHGLVTEGMPIKEACEKVGTHKSNYYHWRRTKLGAAPKTKAIFYDGKKTQKPKTARPEGIYSTQGLLSYYKAPKGERLNLNMIQELPRCFSAKGINWKKAHKLAVEKLLVKVEKRKPGLLL
jgi:transposase